MFKDIRVYMCSWRKVLVLLIVVDAYCHYASLQVRQYLTCTDVLLQPQLTLNKVQFYAMLKELKSYYVINNGNNQI